MYLSFSILVYKEYFWVKDVIAKRAWRTTKYQKSRRFLFSSYDNCCFICMKCFWMTIKYGIHSRNVRSSLNGILPSEHKKTIPLLECTYKKYIFKFHYSLFSKFIKENKLSFLVVYLCKGKELIPFTDGQS